MQVSACVAPGNAPCQTFTLFSTLAVDVDARVCEWIGASSEHWPDISAAGDARDRWHGGGESAAGRHGYIRDDAGENQPWPRRWAAGRRFSSSQSGSGPNERLLAGQSVGGQSVLLGSSQMQVMTTQDGLASIVPSAGNVGPCDVFVAVSAGNSSEQFQLENLAAIVPTLPENIPPKPTHTPPGMRTDQ